MKKYTYKAPGNASYDALSSLTYEVKDGLLSIAYDGERKDLDRILRDGGLLVEPETIKIEAEIDCPVCAKKVETAIAKDPAVISAGFSFERSLITVRGYLTRDEIKAIAKGIEDDIVFRDEKKIKLKAEIDCPVCAKKVEDGLKKVPGITDASFQFERKLLTVKTSLTEEEVKKAAAAIEDGIVFPDDNSYRFKVWIDCAVCAKKVEDRLIHTEGVSSASFQYEKGMLSVSTTLTEDEIKKICLSVEDDMKFLDEKKYRFKVWIDCAVCAKKVEARLLESEGVSNASFQYEKGTLSVTSSLTEDQIKDICFSVEDDMKFFEDEKSYKFRVSIDCAVCAKKVEDRLNRTEGVSSASFEFEKGTLKVTSTLSKEEIRAVCLSVEDDMKFLDDGEIEKKEEKKTDWQLIRIAASLVLLASSFAFDSGLLAIAAYINAGWDVLWKAVKNCMKGQLFDENFLMSIATIGAVIISSYTEAAGVMIFYQVGEYFQRKAVGKSQKRIETLLDLSEESVHRVKADGTTEDVEPEKIAIGDEIRVLPGEKVSLDGVILEGTSTLDMKAINGESVPVDAYEGMTVLSGSINGSGVLDMKAEKEYSDSTASKIMRLVKDSEEKRAKSEAFITRFSKVYTPLVTLLTVLVAIVPPLFFGLELRTWVYRGLMLLVVSCPCALVLSVPLSYFASLGCFAKNGILVKNALTIEKMSMVDTVALDKTGTLTKGNFVLTETNAYTIGKDDAIAIAASLEWNSTHPIGTALKGAYHGKALRVTDLVEKAGTGISGVVDGKLWHLGKLNPSKKEGNDAGTAVFLSDEKETAALFILRDEVKDESREGVRLLKKAGIRKIVMLTGDRKNVADAVGRELGLDEVRSELLPADKTSAIESLRKEGTVLFAGDGINDSPSLITADIGMAMGGVGSDAAIEAADCVLMNDDISKIADGVKIARKTERIVRENIYFSLVIKIGVMVLSILGISNMWLAVFADTGVAMLAALNAARAGVKKNH